MGLHLLGVADEAESKQEISWWDDRAKIARGQDGRSAPEWLWSGDERTNGSLSLNEIRKVADVESSFPEVEALGATRPVELTVSNRVKGRMMSMLAIARFLKINGSLYNGDDEGRWMALPGKSKSTRFQLMSDRAFIGDSGKDCRGQRTFAGITPRRREFAGL